MWRRHFVGIAGALAVVALTACAGGGTSGIVPSQSQPAATGPTGTATSRLQTTSAPEKQIDAIYARKAVARGTINDPLAHWVFLEPLAVTDQAVFSVPRRVTGCKSIDPIFGGLWYLSLTNFTVPVATITLPSCTIPATASSVARPDAVLPAGNGNIYIVEINVGLIYLSTTPIAGPALQGGPSTFLLGPLNGNLSFQKLSVYAFFLAEYTGTGTPTTVTI